jgi:hypothetical protein
MYTNSSTCSILDAPSVRYPAGTIMLLVHAQLLTIYVVQTVITYIAKSYVIRRITRKIKYYIISYLLDSDSSIVTYKDILTTHDSITGALLSITTTQTAQTNMIIEYVTKIMQKIDTLHITNQTTIQEFTEILQKANMPRVLKTENNSRLEQSRPQDVFEIYKNNVNEYRIIMCKENGHRNSVARCKTQGYNTLVFSKVSHNINHIYEYIKSMPESIGRVVRRYYIILTYKATEDKLIEYIQTNI